MAKVAKIWDGTAWVDLATSVPDLSNYQLKSEGGLTFIKKQTIGTAVSSVTVTDAFSATYDNYKIIVSNGVGSTPSNMQFGFVGASSNYYEGGTITSFTTNAITALASNNTSVWRYVGTGQSSAITIDMDLIDPFNARVTRYSAPYMGAETGGNAGIVSGFHNSATSFTGFTINPSGGTLTGGTIYVYGYNKG